MNHQDSPTKCSHPLCYDEATTSSGTCVRHSTVATPSTPKPNNIDPLRVILSRNKAFYFTASKVGNGAREATQIGVSVVRNYFDDYLDDDAAIAAIRLLMVRERIEELRRFTGHGISIHQHSIAKRIAELEQQHKPNHESETI